MRRRNEDKYLGVSPSSLVGVGSSGTSIFEGEGLDLGVGSTGLGIDGSKRLDNKGLDIEGLRRMTLGEGREGGGGFAARPATHRKGSTWNESHEEDIHMAG